MKTQHAHPPPPMGPSPLLHHLRKHQLDQRPKFLDNMQTCVLKVSIHCNGCKNKVRKLLHKVDGVYDITIDGDQGIVTVSGDEIDPEALVKKLTKNGKHAELLSPRIAIFDNKDVMREQFQRLQLEEEKKQKKTKKLNPLRVPQSPSHHKGLAMRHLKLLNKNYRHDNTKYSKLHKPRKIKDEEDEDASDIDLDVDSGSESDFEIDLKSIKRKPPHPHLHAHTKGPNLPKAPAFLRRTEVEHVGNRGIPVTHLSNSPPLSSGHFTRPSGPQFSAGGHPRTAPPSSMFSTEQVGGRQMPTTHTGNPPVVAGGGFPQVYYQGRGPAPAPGGVPVTCNFAYQQPPPPQQQYLAAMAMQQQQQYLAAMTMQQQQQQRMMMQHPMAYSRPPATVSWLPPPSPEYTHYFSDENANSCVVM